MCMGLFQPVPAVGPASTFGKSEHLALMRRLYELYTAYSFLGSRRMTGMLRAGGLRINRKRVQRLMRHMAPGPRPRTKPTPGRKR
jgi:putative transposase